MISLTILVYITPLFHPVEEAIPEANDWDPELFDKYIATGVMVPKGGGAAFTRES